LRAVQVFKATALPTSIDTGTAEVMKRAKIKPGSGIIGVHVLSTEASVGRVSGLSVVE
jgi:hypothetical protein